jgi:hypothetical protein
MGLKIKQFKKGGQTFTDAYAKVGGVRYDNETKIASFGIKIFMSKEDKNLISEIPNLWVRVTPGTDMLAQCYARISTIITQTNAQITNQQAVIDAIVDNDNLKLMKESQLARMKENEVLQLEGSEEL